jgi:poly(A) polymerase
VRAVAVRLRLSNALRDRLVAAAAPPPLSLDLTEREARAALYRLGAEPFADKVAKRWAEAPARAQDARRLLALARAWSRPRLPLTGADVMAMGVAKGPAVGRLIGAVEAWWIEQDFAPDRAAVLAEAAARAASFQ